MSARNAYEALHQRFPGNLRRIQMLQNVGRRLHRQIQDVNRQLNPDRLTGLPAQLRSAERNYFYYDPVGRRTDNVRYWELRNEIINQTRRRNRMMQELRRIRDTIFRLRGWRRN